MSIHTAHRLQNINEYYFSQKLREIEQMNAAGKQVLNLGIGSPDLPPHPAVIQALQAESDLSNVHAYQGYKGIPALRNAFAQWYQTWYTVSLDADTEILPLIGSKEGIMHICMTYLNPGDKALVPNPGYPTYRSAVELAGAEPLPFELSEANQWHPDIAALEAMDLQGVKLMWLNYPNMPTGQLPDADKLQAVVDFAAARGILICHDNPYSFILNKNPWSILSLQHAKDNCIELNSLSKSHNMAGWRVGMLAGNASRIADVLRFKSNMDSGMFKPLQVAAVKALQLDEGWFNELNFAYQNRRKKVYELLDYLQCQYDPQQAGMFVWANIPDGWDNGFALSDDILHKAAVFITPGGIFGSAGDRYIRVSLCSAEKIFTQAIERIKAI